MQLSQYLAPDNEHSQQGNPSVKCNALYKTKENFNCLLTANQAIKFARHLLEKAQLVLDNGIDDAVIHLWNQGEHNEKLFFGLNKARKGPRRKKNVRK